MKPLFCILSICLLAGGGACGDAQDGSSALLGDDVIPADEKILFAPRHYVCYKTAEPLHIDGKLTDAAWQAAAWTDVFVDIQGDAKPSPRLRTRAKMLWDDTYFYVGAALDEPDLWATLTQRDTVIFYDNDFEVFIDPDGDTHAYYELEINALETVWDLMLIKPYRDGGPAINGWDLQGLQARVHADGTLNDPHDRDQGWSVEIALPWAVLKEAAPRREPPRSGDQWRVNFSRVQWALTVEEGRYGKKIDPKTGTPYPEDNWVWSPQGVVNMHRPEQWGYVQFSDTIAGEAIDAFVVDPNEKVKWALRRLYYRQQAYQETYGRYAPNLQALHAADVTVTGLDFEPTMQATERLYEITAPGFDGKTFHIRHDGRVWGE